MPTDISGEIEGKRATQDNPLAVAFNARYAVIIDESSSTIIYVGKAIIGSLSSASVWQIMRIQVISTQTIITWADGNNFFDNIWDNRASLNYS